MRRPRAGLVIFVVPHPFSQCGVNCRELFIQAHVELLGLQLEIDETGLSPYEAILVASERRVRPILLTTATTVGGLLPLWFGGGPMWEPMAIAIIFGLLFATVLTLGVVPTLYSVFFRVQIPHNAGGKS